MAEINPSATTTPKVSMRTELYYTSNSGYTGLTQIFMVQEIPVLQNPKDAINYGCLESSTEFTTEGTRKAETITVPLLYVKAQNDTLKAIADAGTKLYFVVKLPDSTAETAGHPNCYKFSGKIDLTLDTMSIDGMIQENLTIYRDSLVSEDTWNNISA